MDRDQFFDALAEVPNLRSATLDDIEIKDGGNVFLFDGYAAVFGERADLGGDGVRFVEEVAPGAFRSVLESGQNVPMLHEHHPHQLLATTRSGRLKLEEDGHGLRVRAKLVKTDLSARIKALADAGDITGMSYGFVAGRGNQKIERRDGGYHRLLTGFKKLLDVATTWNPAYPNTEAQFRAKALEFADSPESWQQILMGAYPQLEGLGDDDPDGMHEPGEEHRTDSDTPPGVDDAAHDAQRFAAAKRRLSFIELTGGCDYAS